MPRAAILFLFLGSLPSQKQNLALTDEGQPICGSVLLTENLVLTAAHCVRSEDGSGFEEYVDIRCGSTDSPARVIKASMDQDLALLRLVSPCDDNRNNISVLANANPPLGAEVHAIGYPAGHQRLSHGIVSAYETSLIQGFARHPVLVSDTKIYFGNSGGGLFNPANELVGIASQLDQAGFGYWIPVSSIHQFLDGI